MGVERRGVWGGEWPSGAFTHGADPGLEGETKFTRGKGRSVA